MTDGVAWGHRAAQVEGDESLPQSAVISDADLDAVLDRRDLEGTLPKGAKPPAPRGVGYEFVEDNSSKGILSAVE